MHGNAVLSGASSADDSLDWQVGMEVLAQHNAVPVQGYLFVQINYADFFKSIMPTDVLYCFGARWALFF
jgi:hypothetical protein